MNLLRSEGVEPHKIEAAVSVDCLNLAIITFTTIYRFTDDDQETFRRQVGQLFRDGIKAFGYGELDE